MRKTPGIAPAAGRSLDDILAAAAEKATAPPEHDARAVLERVHAELGSPEAKRFLARLTALHGLLADDEPGRQFVANVVAITAAASVQVRTRLAELTKA